MNEPRKISPMDGDKLDPLSRPPVRIPSFSKLTGEAPAVTCAIPVFTKPRQAKAATTKPVGRPEIGNNEFRAVIAALRVKRDKLSAAIEALEELG